MAETANTGGYGPPSSSSRPGDGSDVREQAQEKANAVKGQAKEQAQQVAGQARSRMQSEIDARSTQAGQQVTQQASDMRSVAEQLRSQGKDAPAKIADQVAQRVERTGQWMTNADADQLLNDIEDFGRRNPWAVMLGGITLGFVASRFLKASSQQRFARSSGYSTTGYGNRALPERTSDAYPDEPGQRFTRTAGGTTAAEPPAPPTGTGGLA